MPQRDAFLRNLLVGGAVALLLVGSGVLVGWFAGMPVLVRWLREAPPAPPAGALGLLVFGLALLGRTYGGRLWISLAALPALAGLWSLLESGYWVPAGFDAWLVPGGAAEVGVPGRMAPAVACGFIAAGVGLAALALPWPGRWRVLLAAGFGSLVGGAGLAAFLGHITGLVPATMLGWDEPMALPMAIGILVLGSACVAVAVGEREPEAGPARWLPAPFMIGCMTATLIVWLALREAAQATVANDLSGVVLGSGLAFALLLGLVVDLAQKARQRQLRAEAAATRVLAEDRERRRLAGQLKASEDRLSLALEAGQIGTFDWDLITGEAFFSSGVWHLLGYTPSAMAARMAAWDALLHPEDRDFVQTERPRGPRQGFREVEYRVRNAAGDWRWILERSKAVAFSNDGLPRRIAGTFQDINQRKQTELDLRTSQAEARKLAIVASITDNFVAITDGAGAVEWINESFGRHLGWAPAEAVGRPLTDLLPPLPGELGSASALREAFVRRLPAQAEIATISQRGRHFHLHGEIQPVNGTRGEIEKFIAVFHDVSKRIEVEARLREAKAQAEAGTRAKSEFLASMSHEIRTPMNGVIGLARLLLDSPLSAEQQDWVRTIQLSGDALLTILNDILDFSKIESGRMELERYPFNPADCVEEALELFAIQAGEKRLEMAYCVAPGVPSTVVGDRARLRQVLVNLVSNAVKFTPAGRIGIEVRPGETAHELAFTVSDTGIGIPSDRVESLFQPFSQLDASTTRHYGGTGLGLAICKRLVELMGGSIGAHSRQHAGSVFHFTVELAEAPVAVGGELPATPLTGRRAVLIDDDPVAQRFVVQVLEHEGYLVRCFDSLAAAQEGLADSAAPDVILVDQTLPAGDGLAAAGALRALYPRDTTCLLLLSLAGQVPPREVLTAAEIDGFAVKPLRRQALRDRLAAAMKQPSVPSAAGGADARSRAPLAEAIPLRVLLAEDNPVNKKVALRLLERLGYKPDSVGTGTDAVQAVAEHGYEIVFMDVQMPELDGLEATRRIRSSLPAVKQPAIVALTANAIAGDAEMCRAAGMDDYLSKPVTPEDIHNVIVRRFGDGRGIEPLGPGGLS